MDHYSYRVLKSAGKGWDWELISPSREIHALGVAEDRAKAAAHAMLAWLNRVKEQGDAMQRDAGVVRH
jgi:hypothetical protein